MKPKYKKVLNRIASQYPYSISDTIYLFQEIKSFRAIRMIFGVSMAVGMPPYYFLDIFRNRLNKDRQLFLKFMKINKPELIDINAKTKK